MRRSVVERCARPTVRQFAHGARLASRSWKGIRILQHEIPTEDLDSHNDYPSSDRWFPAPAKEKRKSAARSIGVRRLSLENPDSSQHAGHISRAGETRDCAEMSRASETGRIGTAKRLETQTTPNPSSLRERFDAATTNPRLLLGLLKEVRERPGGHGTIWENIIACRIELPTTGSEASQVWGILLTDPLQHEKAVQYAIDLRTAHHGASFGPLYTIVMMHWLQSSPRKSKWAELHKKLIAEYTFQPNALRLLAAKVAQAHSKAESRFRTIYFDLFDHSDSIYDQLVPSLLEAAKFEEARYWHQLLRKNNDYPSAFTEESALYQKHELFLNGEMTEPRMPEDEPPVLSPRLLPVVKTKRSDDRIPMPQIASLDLLPENLSKGEEEPALAIPNVPPRRTVTSPGFFTPLPTGEKHTFAEKKFSDELCARLFATTMLTPSWVIAFIHGFGVDLLEPLALRELAIRCDSSRELRKHLKDLKGRNIALSESKFSAVVQKWAFSNDFDMLRDLLRDDQHPLNLDNFELQRILFRSAMDADNRAKAHRILTVMCMSSRSPDEAYLNQMLVYYISRRRAQDVSLLMSQAESKGLSISVEAIDACFTHLLTRRDPSRRPRTLGCEPRVREKDALSVTTKIFLQAIKDGTEPRQHHWTEIFKRHGMMGFTDLAKLCHAIINTYREVGQRADSNHSVWTTRHRNVYLERRCTLPIHDPAHPAHKLFSPLHLQAIIAWGFAHGLGALSVDCEQRVGRSERLDSGRKQAGGRAHRFGGRRAWPTSVPPPPLESTFLRGLKLVQDLKAAGVGVSDTDIKDAIRSKLWSLYGPGRSLRRHADFMRRLNPYSVFELLQAVNEITKEAKLFPEIEAPKGSIERTKTEPRPTAECGTLHVSEATGRSRDSADLPRFEGYEIDQHAQVLLKIFGRPPRNRLLRAALDTRAQEAALDEESSTWAEKWDLVKLDWARMLVRESLRKE